MAELSKQRRIALLDEIRGFCILCMVLYHGFYLLGAYTRFAFFSAWFRFFQPVEFLFAASFILISGICTQFSRSVLLHGCKLAGIAACISVITVFLLPRIGYTDFADKFGILHLLSFSMLFCGFLHKVLCKGSPLLWSVVFLCLFCCTCSLERGYFGVPFLQISIPEKLTASPYLFPLGFHGRDFFSADYFPILPNLFIFLIGTQAGRVLQARPLSERAYLTHVPPLAFLGRHSLTLYLAHVPLIWVIILIIERF